MTTIKIAKVTFRYTDYGTLLKVEHMFGMSVNGSPWMFTSANGVWDFLAEAAEHPDAFTIQCVPSFIQTRELNPKGAI